jgi:hypothetical protein
MKIAVRHRLRVGLAEGAGRSALHLLLTPQNGPTQTVQEWQLDVEGLDGAAGFVDGYGNRAHLVTQTRAGREIIVGASGIVETADTAGVVGRPPGEPVPALFKRKTGLSKSDPDLVAEYADWSEGRIALLHALMARATEWPEAHETFEEEGGQNQVQDQALIAPELPSPSDMAHRFIGAARALGIPARYVTGYLTAAEDEPAAFHAWAEAWDDGLGWIGFDPSLQLCPTERHIRVAIGLDAVSTAPVRAVPAEGDAQSVSVMVEAAQ